MSLLKTCLTCFVAAVAAIGPPVDPYNRPVSGRKPNFSNRVNVKERTLMKNKMEDLATRVARMEQRGDHQKDALQKMTKDVFQITNNLKATFKDVSRRMDVLEHKLGARATSQGQSHTELAAEDAPAEVTTTVSHRGHADNGQETLTKAEPTRSRNVQTKVNPTVSKAAHGAVEDIKYDDEAGSNVNHLVTTQIDGDKDGAIVKVNMNDVPQENLKDMQESSKDNNGDGNVADLSGETEKKVFTEEEIAAKIEACGRPPMKEGQSAEVSMYGSKVTATYSCSKQYVLITPDDISFSYCTDGEWSPVKAYCSNLTTCGHKNLFRMEYNGMVNVTKSGKPCQHWLKQTPHRHKYGHEGEFRYTTGFEGGETLQQASNYCRDPGVMSYNKQAWCFTTDPNRRWELCDVPVCS